MKRFTRLPSPAMIVASVALFVALGGTSYAVATGSIDSREIKNGTIVEKDVKKSGLEGSDIKDGALAARDVKAGSLTADRFAGGQLPRRPAGCFVNDQGQIAAQSGGFTVKSAFQGNPAGAAGNVYIDSGEDLGDNGIVASNALQNARDANGDGVDERPRPGRGQQPRVQRRDLGDQVRDPERGHVRPSGHEHEHPLRGQPAQQRRHRDHAVPTASRST